MPEHVVTQHETIPSIAEVFGLAWQRIWRHPRNASLRATRTPTLLLPGDVVFVPDAPGPDERKGVECATGRMHRFVMKYRPLRLRLRLVNYFGSSFAGAVCRLRVGGAEHELTADAEGTVECEIPPRTRTATLSVGDLELLLAVGALDPLKEPSGICGRLLTLGFDPGEPGEDEEALRWAIEEFQASFGLEPTLDASTAEGQLKTHYGC